MRATDILTSEHRVIEQVLDCLERMVQQSQRTGVLDGRSAGEAIEFFRTFADACHHGKEEAHLFPAMEAKGFSQQSGPTGVMLREHESGRAYIRGMDQYCAAAAAGEAEAVTRFGRFAQGYVELLREHIAKEDHCLFGMANQAFEEADQQALLDAFERVEAEHMGAGTHEKFLAIATALAERYGVHGSSATAGCGHCCGH